MIWRVTFEAVVFVGVVVAEGGVVDAEGFVLVVADCGGDWLLKEIGAGVVVDDEVAFLSKSSCMVED